VEGQDVLVIPFPPLPPLGPLYAETHYRFRLFPSWLKKNEPEVIADAPHRIEPGKDLPVFLLVKDADRYPAKISNLSITVTQHGNTLSELNVAESFSPKDRYWWKVWNIPLQDVKGFLELQVRFALTANNRTIFYQSDNHRTSSKRPLRVFATPEALPLFPGWFAGEGHSHSDRTDDQVEFGVPPEPAMALSLPMGLSFVAITDHSYDLDDHPHDYLQNHADIPKWHALQEDLHHLNRLGRGFVFLRGEEVSCRTANGANVHLLMLGNSGYIPGSGDSAERWLQTRSEFSIAEVLSRKDEGAAAIAAHAREPVSWLQKALLGRGFWEREDLQNSGLDGMQFANGKSDPSFDEGRNMWISLLLAGKRLVLLGGDDAHGNFNRFRQIGIPFFSIREHGEQLFGVTRTVVRSETLDEPSLLAAIKSGRSVISDGPVLDLRNNGRSVIGERLPLGPVGLEIHVRTSSEYGTISELRLMYGRIGGDETEILTQPHRENVLTARLDPNARGYLRAECWTNSQSSAYGRSHFCFTNPVWIAP